ncbi:MAG: BatD family protein [Halioglobus sp.]
MRPTGNLVAISLAICLALVSTSAVAEVTASVDRDRVSLGDVLSLTIASDAGENTNNIDLRPLLNDFDILKRSTTSSTRVVNGKTTRTRQVLLDITPKRQGTLRIPPLRVDRSETNSLLIAVTAPAAVAPGNDTVVFEAVVDQQEVYVQGQVILTLRIQQAINLDARSVTELQLDDAFVKPLEQKSFQRTVDGKPWLVHEIRYAIFPEQSGSLEIPGQTFSARESLPRRSLFDLGSNGKQIRRTTDPIKLTVLPRPAEFIGDNWLPARNLTVQEVWSTPPEQLAAGESATRTIVITAEGLQGAQLPPVLFPATQGLKYYPDQPVIEDAEVSSGLSGTRSDSAALVPTRTGSWELPELRVPWWDTQAKKMRVATLPARTINVSATAGANTFDAPVAAPAPATITTPATAGEIAIVQQDNVIWQIVAAVSASGWLLTLAYLLYFRRSPKQAKPTNTSYAAGEKSAYKRLIAACSSNGAAHVRPALIAWAQAFLEGRTVTSLEEAKCHFADDEFDRELQALDIALYGEVDNNWSGQSLAGVVNRLRKQRGVNASGLDSETLELYPAN